MESLRRKDKCKLFIEKPFVGKAVPADVKAAFKSIYKQFKIAVSKYHMIEDGDKIGVAMSGGKDSWVLLVLLKKYLQESKEKFTIVPITVDTGFGEFSKNIEQVSEFCETQLGIEHVIAHENFPLIINENKTENKSSCSFCARLRRGSLYTKCVEVKATKLALGHHREDINESLLMSLFLNGRIWSQRPNYSVEVKRQLEKKGEEGDEEARVVGRINLIRPLFMCAEQHIRTVSNYLNVPIISCNCKFEGDPNHKRAVMKTLIANLATKIPRVENNILSACIDLFDNNKMELDVDDNENYDHNK